MLIITSFRLLVAALSTIAASTTLAIPANAQSLRLAAERDSPIVPGATSLQPSSPDLRVFIFNGGSDPRPVTASGQTVSITIGTANRGADAHGVILSATLPGGFRLERTNPPADRVERGTKLIWNLGTVKAGELRRSFEITAQVSNDVAAGSELAVTAAATSSDADANLQKNNSGAYRIYVQQPGADLTVESDLSAVPLTVNRVATFRARVMNAGNTQAQSVMLTLTLPKSIKLNGVDPQPDAKPSDNVVSWQLGDIARGDSRTVAVTVELDKRLTPVQPGFQIQSLAFIFDASSARPDIDPSDNHLEVFGHVEREGNDVAVWLAVEGADEPGELTVGKDVIYVIRYANVGREIAQKTNVSLSLPSGLSLTKADPLARDGATSNTSVDRTASWDIGDLRVGESLTIRAHVHVASVPEEGARVTAVISADGHDINPDNNKAESLRRAARSENKMLVSPPADSVVGRLASAPRWLWWVAAIAAIALISFFWLMIRSSRKKKASSPTGSKS